MSAHKNLPETRSSSRISPISGSILSPMREMIRMQRGLERMVDEMMSPVYGSSISPIYPLTTGWLSDEERMTSFMPPVDIDETDSHYLVNMDLPGVKKNEIQIDVRNQQLVISGERKQECVHDKGMCHSLERYHGRFQRSFSLPGTIDVDKIEAHFEDGVLQIAVPKVETATKKTIAIGEGKVQLKHGTDKIEKKDRVA